MERGEDTSSIGSAKEQTDAEGEAMEDFLKSKIGKGLTREDIKSITKKEGGWESKLISKLELQYSNPFLICQFFTSTQTTYMQYLIFVTSITFTSCVKLMLTNFSA